MVAGAPGTLRARQVHKGQPPQRPALQCYPVHMLSRCGKKCFMFACRACTSKQWLVQTFAMLCHTKTHRDIADA